MSEFTRTRYHAIRDRFGAAGVIIAVIALIAAVGGTALAAGGLTKSQEKQVIKIAKKYAGKPGAPGATGPAGPAGTNGTNGENGAPGTNGENGKSAEAGTPFTGIKTIGSVKCENGGVPVKSASPETAVCNGKNGTTGFTETLPSGKTEAGVWSAIFSATAAGQAVTAPISFNIPLAEAPEAALFTFIGPEEGEGEAKEKKAAIPSHCKGTVENPQAVPGNLCVFVRELGGPSNASLSPFGFLFFDPQSGAPETAGKSGVWMDFASEAAGFVTETGVWAVTAK
jgi:hypothetical protein